MYDLLTFIFEWTIWNCHLFQTGVFFLFFCTKQKIFVLKLLGKCIERKTKWAQNTTYPFYVDSYRGLYTGYGHPRRTPGWQGHTVLTLERLSFLADLSVVQPQKTWRYQDCYPCLQYFINNQYPGVAKSTFKIHLRSVSSSLLPGSVPNLGSH